MEDEDFPDGVVAEMSAQEALAFTIRFLNSNPSDDVLCSAALTIGEPLVDWHWAEIEQELEDLSAADGNMRKMLSCCSFDSSVPDRVWRRILRHVADDEHVGRRPRAVTPPGSLRLRRS